MSGAVKGIDLRKSKLKKELNGISEEQVDLNQLEDNPQQEHASYVQRSKKLLEKILTSITEFQITSQRF
jgi:hypothetical protein